MERLCRGLAVTLLAVAISGGCDRGEKSTSNGTSDEGPAVVKVVNSYCPIMTERKIVGDVPKAFSREFGGQTVGFCCAVCPPQWDKLTDQQKREKLDAAIKKGQ